MSPDSKKKKSVTDRICDKSVTGRKEEQHQNNIHQQLAGDEKKKEEESLIRCKLYFKEIWKFFQQDYH